MQPSPPAPGRSRVEPPLVTIVSPVYNQERHVARCVESALAQSYPRWEQVVVDDGSTDRTRQIAGSYGDPRIRVVPLPHRGLGALARSYNSALAASGGSLVAVLEGDDLWPPDKLEKQVPLFDDPRTVLAWGRALIVDDAGREVGQRSTVRSRQDPATLTTREAFVRLTRTNFLAPAVTVMARRCALDAVGGFRQDGSALFVDLATWLLVTAVHDGNVRFADHDVGTYRVHSQQTSQRRRAQMAREHWRVVEAVVASLDADALRRAGWDNGVRRGALSRGMLAEGEIGLASGDRRAAYASFRDAFRLGRSTRDRALALLGMASAAAGADLVTPAFALRERLGAG